MGDLDARVAACSIGARRCHHSDEVFDMYYPIHHHEPHPGNSRMGRVAYAKTDEAGPICLAVLLLPSVPFTVRPLAQLESKW